MLEHGDNLDNAGALTTGDIQWMTVSTVKTHMSHLYAKLGSHHRTEAVDRARALGLLAPT